MSLANAAISAHSSPRATMLSAVSGPSMVTTSWLASA